MQDAHARHCRRLPPAASRAIPLHLWQRLAVPRLCGLPPAPECVPASVLYRVGLSSQDPPCPPLQRARLDRSQAAGAPAVGDVLRACTCTTFVFPTNSLFGAKPPQRHIVCYGADQQKWTQVQPRCMLQTGISEL